MVPKARRHPTLLRELHRPSNEHQFHPLECWLSCLDCYEVAWHHFHTAVTMRDIEI